MILYILLFLISCGAKNTSKNTTEGLVSTPLLALSNNKKPNKIKRDKNKIDDLLGKEEDELRNDAEIILEESILFLKRIDIESSLENIINQDELLAMFGDDSNDKLDSFVQTIKKIYGKEIDKDVFKNNDVQTFIILKIAEIIGDKESKNGTKVDGTKKTIREDLFERFFKIKLKKQFYKKKMELESNFSEQDVDAIDLNDRLIEEKLNEQIKSPFYNDYYKNSVKNRLKRELKTGIFNGGKQIKIIQEILWLTFKYLPEKYKDSDEEEIKDNLAYVKARALDIFWDFNMNGSCVDGLNGRKENLINEISSLTSLSLGEYPTFKETLENIFYKFRNAITTETAINYYRKYHTFSRFVWLTSDTPRIVGKLLGKDFNLEKIQFNLVDLNDELNRISKDKGKLLKLVLSQHTLLRLFDYLKDIKSEELIQKLDQYLGTDEISEAQIDSGAQLKFTFNQTSLLIYLAYKLNMVKKKEIKF